MDKREKDFEHTKTLGTLRDCAREFLSLRSSYDFELLLRLDNAIAFVEDVEFTRSANSASQELFEVKVKPTRTEYVKVEESIFDLKAEFEAGELFAFRGDKRPIKTVAHLGACFDVDEIYRKVEREITWQDEVERLYPVNAISGHVSFKQLITDEQFIEMCHKVYHLTK